MKEKKKKKRYGSVKVAGPFDDTPEGRQQAEMFKRYYGTGCFITRKNKKLWVMCHTKLEQTGDWEWKKGNIKILVRLHPYPTITIFPPVKKERERHALTRKMEGIWEKTTLVYYDLVKLAKTPLENWNLGKVPKHLFPDLRILIEKALSKAKLP